MSQNSTNNIQPLKPSYLRPLVEICMATNRAVFLWGPPGIGKSDLVRQIARGQSPHDSEGNVVEEERVEVFDVRLLLLEPTDIRGLPYRNPETNQMLWSEPSVLPPQYILEDKKTGEKARIPNNKRSILFLDEMTAAPQSVQAAAYQLVLDRKVGDYKLPEKCAIIAAGNRTNDRGVVYPMPTPLRNRFVHFEMAVDFEDWAEWALANRIHPEVMAFISESPSKLHQFDPASKDLAFPTPRSWAFVSDILYGNENARGGMSDHLLKNMVGGCVGMGVATEFQAHREFAKDLPPIKDILSGKAKKMGTKNVSAEYFLSSALCYALHDKFLECKKAGDQKEFHEQADNFLGFIMENFRKELVVMSMRVALKQMNIAFSTKDMENWKPFFKDYGKMIASAINLKT